MALRPKIAAERLREIVRYNSRTGVFTWRITRKKCTAGAIVGRVDDRGYLTAKLDYRIYYLHRAAWLYMTGTWPANDIDHIDQNKSNNRWRNLREATRKQNIENGPRRKNNTSGEIGVTWNKLEKKWVARITHKRKKLSLGYFVNFDDAVAARRAGVLKLFTHAPACGIQDACPDITDAHGIADPAL